MGQELKSALALVLVVLAGCQSSVDVSTEKTPDAGSVATNPSATKKPMQGGFEHKETGSNTGLKIIK